MQVVSLPLKAKPNLSIAQRKRLAQVVPLPLKRKPDPKIARRKWLALQLAIQLPEEAAEALLVLEATIVLVKTFLAPDGL